MSKYFSVQCFPSQKEHCSFEGPQASNICPSSKSIIKASTNKEDWQNNTDGGNLKYPDKNLFHCHSFTKNLTWIGPGSNPGLCCERLVLNCLNHSRTCMTNLHLNYVCCKKSLPTTQRISFISITKTSCLMLFLARISHNYKNNIYVYKDIHNCSFACCFVWV